MDRVAGLPSPVGRAASPVSRLFRRFGRCVLVFVITAVVCVVLQYASTYLPIKPIQRHVAQSVAPFLSLESPRYLVGHDVKYGQDLYTDSIMLNQAVPYEKANHLANAFGATFLDNSKTPIQGLLLRVHSWDMFSSQYLRYWHGYIVPLRVLLEFFTYQQILVVQAILLGILLLAIVFLLCHRFTVFLGVSFAVSLCAMAFIAVPLSLQFFGVFFIAFLGILFELLASRAQNLRNVEPEVFVVLGVLTVWIDFLTAPLITLGLPLLVALLLEKDTERALLLRATVAWVVSYATFWALRWVLAGIMYPGAGIAANVAEGVSFRAGLGQGPDQKMTALAKNLAMIFPHPASLDAHHLGQRAYIGAAIIAALALGVFVFWLLRARRPRLRVLLPFLGVGAYPFVWYVALPNHSSIHAYFVSRTLSITFFAAACIAYRIATATKPPVRQ